MAYEAKVLQVLVASPSDVPAERKAIPEVIYQWNTINSKENRIVLLPVLWETHSAPELGDRPQAIINRQLVNSCDILIGVFWTRLGTHTGEAESGTVEEIEQFRKSGKPVMLYFSSAPVVMESVDMQQYKGLINFKEKCKKEGLIEEYSDVNELRWKILRHLNSVSKSGEGDTQPKIEKTNDISPQDSLEIVKEQLASLLTRSEANWSTEVKSQPAELDEGRYIIETLINELLNFRVSIQDMLSNDFIGKLENQITLLKNLKNHEVYIDGGNSYRQFWEIGNEIYSKLRGLLHEVSSKDILNVKKIKKNILNKFKSINADVDHSLPPRWLQQQFIPNLTPKEKEVVQSAIDELVEDGSVELFGNQLPNLRITKKGIDQLY